MQTERFFAADFQADAAVARTIQGKRRTVPETWAITACESFAPAFVADRPSNLLPVEENTTPSWLWKHGSASQESVAEESANAVFARVAGAATYRGWKAGLWTDEQEARNFMDEAVALLSERALALPASQIVKMGCAWAYGRAVTPLSSGKKHSQRGSAAASSADVVLPNETIDALMRGKPSHLGEAWTRLLTPAKTLTVRFQDTAREWVDDPTSALPQATPCAVIDLLRFIGADGRFDVPAYLQTIRIATMLLDLSGDDLGLAETEDRSVALGFANLGSVLMALGLAYDSQAGRAAAASVSAMLTGESIWASAQLAACFGPCAAYRREGEAKRRRLRNQYRAAHGERTDFERITVLPPSLEIADNADLLLVSEARRTWERALDAVDRHGLRSFPQTRLIQNVELADFLESGSIDLLPEKSLLQDAVDETGELRALSPAFRLGLQAAKIDPGFLRSLASHVAGARTLKGAPHISPDDLRSVGFDSALIATVENRIPETSKIGLVFSPWVLGIEACRALPGLKDAPLEDYSFDLLQALGLSPEAIAEAEAYLYGHGTLASYALGDTPLSSEIKAIFRTQDETDPQAIVKMTAALQPFFAHDIGLGLAVAEGLSAEERGELLLSGWREGLWSLKLETHTNATTRKSLAEKTGIKAKSMRGAPAPLPAPTLPGDRSLSSTLKPSRATKPKAAGHTISKAAALAGSVKETFSRHKRGR